MSTENQCGAKTRAGGECKLRAGHGTDHVGRGKCRRHGGNTPNHKTAARREEAVEAVETYGLPRDVAPHQALMEELHRTAGHVAWLELVIRDLEQEQLHAEVGGSKDSAARREPHVWVRLYQSEREHMARVAKTCIEVGIEERRVRIAEQTGEAFAKALQGILAALGMADDPRVPKLVRKHLTLLESGQ